MGKTALLIVDVQNALVDEKPYNIEKVLGNIKKLLDKCRENETEVTYIQHDGENKDTLEPFSYGWDIHKSIYHKSGDKIIRKTYNSAFKDRFAEVKPLPEVLKY